MTGGQRTLAIELDTGREVSFGELLARVETLASKLRTRGLGPGKSLVIHLYNSIDAMVVHLAAQYIGARSCFVDALVQPKALPYYVEITDCALLVTRCSNQELCEAGLAQTPVILADEIPALTEPAPARRPGAPYDWPRDAVCYVYFTSGTTSEPKGVMLSGANHESFTRICTQYWQPVTAESRHLCFVPFSHGFGTIFLVPLALRTGGALYILRAFHPMRVIDAIAHHGITHIYGVPSHYQQLLRMPGAACTLSKLKMAFCAAAKLEHELMLRWEEASGTVLCEGYGLIETCCGTTWRVGVPSRGTGDMGPCPDPHLAEFAIFDEEMRRLGPGETGQIAVRGQSVMQGYLKRETLTAQVMVDGWFLTGDEGHITADGELFLTGRIKDIINIAGIKVSPFEVEAVLQNHPAVAEVAVVATSDALYGEVVKAYVRPRENVEICERDLIRFASERLINFQVPKRVEFLDAFPVTNMGKLDRKKLRALNPV